MIAKIVKGSSFKGVLSYILDKEKDAKILVCDGLFAENKDTIAMSFEAQSKMNPKVTKPVGHISLAFHKEDEHRLADRAMAGIALEYLKEMGITDTQVLIVRHFDKEHPHMHITFNRIADNGRTISDRNERIRSARICKELTRKRQLAANLKKQGVDMRFKYKGKSDEVQGVVFTMNGYSFSGSKIDRRFSFSKIDAALESNRHTERLEIQSPLHHEEQPILPSKSRGSDDLYSGSIGLFMPDNSNSQADETYFEGHLKRKNKKKKQRKIRF